jgi:hypothetical protein
MWNLRRGLRDEQLEQIISSTRPTVWSWRQAAIKDQSEGSRIRQQDWRTGNSNRIPDKDGQ